MRFMIGDKRQWEQNRRLYCGFSVMELLIVVSIFSMATVAISATYINFTRLHRQVANAETLGEELRYISELLVRSVRNNRIAYVTDPLPYTRDQLHLDNASDQRISFAHIDDADPVCNGLEVTTGCLGMYVEGVSTGYVPLTGYRIDIEDFVVYTTPVDDPFTPLSYGVYSSDRQPVVTIFIKATYLAANARERVTMSLQTSVASRVYVR